MKREHLGDAKDRFKWDYHDHLTRKLGYSTLNVVLMMTDDDDTPHGSSPPGDYPASDGVLELYRKLRHKRCPALIGRLPGKTGSSYSVEFHKGNPPFRDCREYRREYFDGFKGDKDQVVFVDPDTGFEPPGGGDERHEPISKLDFTASA